MTVYQRQDQFLERQERTKQQQKVPYVYETLRNKVIICYVMPSKPGHALRCGPVVFHGCLMMGHQILSQE